MEREGQEVQLSATEGEKAEVLLNVRKLQISQARGTLDAALPSRLCIFKDLLESGIFSYSKSSQRFRENCTCITNMKQSTQKLFLLPERAIDL